MSEVSFFCMYISICPKRLLYPFSFLGIFVRNKLTISVYFWALISIPSINICILVPVPYFSYLFFSPLATPHSTWDLHAPPRADLWEGTAVRMCSSSSSWGMDMLTSGRNLHRIQQHPLQTKPGFASWLFCDILSQRTPTLICTVDSTQAQQLTQLTFLVTLHVPAMASAICSYPVLSTYCVLALFFLDMQ